MDILTHYRVTTTFPFRIIVSWPSNNTTNSKFTLELIGNPNYIKINKILSCMYSWNESNDEAKQSLNQHQLYNIFSTQWNRLLWDIYHVKKKNLQSFLHDWIFEFHKSCHMRPILHQINIGLDVFGVRNDHQSTSAVPQRQVMLKC